MAWTKAARKKYARKGLRYTSDLTEAEWLLLSFFLPPPSHLGRPRTTSLREVLNALLYMARNACNWRCLPKDFPPYTTVQRYFYRWNRTELWRTINFMLVMMARQASGREASPTAGIIDSQAGTHDDRTELFHERFQNFAAQHDAGLNRQIEVVWHIQYAGYSGNLGIEKLPLSEPSELVSRR